MDYGKIFSPNVGGISSNASLGLGSLPLSINLAAVGWAQYAAKELIHFKQANYPLTDRSWWEGRYVLCPVHLRAQTESGTVEVECVDAVAAVSRERRIVSTALAGRDGTVKEYINEGDWAVSLVVGVQATEGGRITDEYPADALRELRKILDVKDRVEVASEFLKIFDITHIVIKSYSATQTTEQNYQAVSISAVSDEAVEIYSNEYK